MHRSGRINEHKKEHLDLLLVPMKVFLWVIGLYFAIDILAAYYEYTGYFVFLKPLRNAGFVTIALWTVLRWKGHYLQKHMPAKNGDRAFSAVLDRMITIFSIFISSLLILEIFGVNILPLITFGGVGAAAIGFAAKDVISNFFGGMMLFVNKRIAIGDYILIPGKNVDGVVEEIGWFTTSIRDKEKRLLFIPNSFFSSSFLTNATRITHRKLDQKLHLQAANIDSLEELVEKIRRFLQGHVGIDTSQILHVYLSALKEDCQEIHLVAYSYYTKEEEFLLLQHHILLEVVKMIKQLGLKLGGPSIHFGSSLDIKNSS